MVWEFNSKSVKKKNDAEGGETTICEAIIEFFRLRGELHNQIGKKNKIASTSKGGLTTLKGYVL
jgi:hypothetical protein